MPIAEVKAKLPQYVIARKLQGLFGENAKMYERKRQEFAQLIAKEDK